MQLETLAELLNAHFGPPFLSEGVVEAGVKSDTLFLRIGRRSVEFDDEGTVHNSGTLLGNDGASLVGGRAHPLFKIALHRATKKQERLGAISHEDADQMYEAILLPNRKAADGRTCDLVEELRKHTVKAIQADSTFQASYGIDPKDVEAVTFNWSSIWQWIKDHWLQVLQALLSLLSIFIMFA
jgi:hypothetical protein